MASYSQLGETVKLFHAQICLLEHHNADLEIRNSILIYEIQQLKEVLYTRQKILNPTLKKKNVRIRDE